MPLTKAQAADFLSALPDATPSEIVRFAPAGGDVIVRGMGLTQRLQISIAQKAGLERAPEVLAATVFVLDENDNEVPLADAAKWQVIGHKYYAETLALMGAVNRLSGLEDASGN